MDLSTFFSVAPKIILFLVFFLGIALFFEFFYVKRQKKTKVLTKETIPPVPPVNAGTAKFAANYKAPLVKKAPNVNKKILFSVIALGIIIVSGLSVYLATRSQPQTSKSKADEGVKVDVVRAIGAKQGNTLNAGGELKWVAPPEQGTFTSETRVDMYHCLANDVHSCSDQQVNSTSGSVQVPKDGISTVTFQQSFDMSNQCGTYQIDSYYDDGNGLPGPGGKTAGTFLYNFPEPCPGSTPRPTQSPSETPGVTNTPTPLPTDIPGTYRITGRVYEFCAETPPNPDSCPATGVATNEIQVDVKQGNTIIQTQITHFYEHADGAFLFQNLAPGTYSVCTSAPSGSQFYCSSKNPTGNCFSATLPPESSQNVVLLKQTTACGPAATATPAAATPTPNPTNSLTSIPAKSTPTPSSTPTGTPNPTPTNTPVPTQTPKLVDATPTVTPYIIVNATNTPAPGETIIAQASPTAQPTIPSAGVPLSAFAIGIPLLLILLAFVL
jgi:hypothetical protein